MTNARPFAPSAPFKAFAAEAALWLVAVLAWLVSPFGGPIARQVRRELSDDLAWLRQRIVMFAFLEADVRLPPKPPAPRRPPNAPKGVRRSRGCRRRAVWRVVRGGPGLAARVAALRRALYEMPALIARLKRRMERETPIVVAYVMAVAPRERVRAQARVALDAIDSS